MSLSLRSQLEDWLGGRRWTNSIAFTGHLRSSASALGSNTGDRRFIAVARHNRFFCTRIDRAVFGSVSRKHRGGKRVPRVLVIENGALCLHVHGLFSFPEWLDPSEASELLRQHWVAAPHGANDVLCEPALTPFPTASSAKSWGGYIFKQVTAGSLTVDFETLVLPAADIN